MAKLNALRADLKKESAGVWERYPNSDVSVLVARLGNPKFEAQARLLRKNARLRRKAEGGEITESEAQQAIAPAVAQHILLGWKNLEGDDGKPIEYSPARALELLNDPTMHDFYSWILRVAGDGDLFRLEVEEELAGNSAGASSGSSSTGAPTS